MADKANTNAKTQVFNLVILDKSGSMSSIRQATINGLNETINGIRMAQEKHADDQEHFFTLHTFCSCEQKKVYDCAPIAEVRDITEADYQPCCCTPLYDAIGLTLSRMKRHVAEIENSVVVVTIITDGYENASKKYNGNQVAEMIAGLREQGWAFAYMGADHDVEAVAKSMNIVNTRRFEHTSEGTTEGMAFDSKSRMAFFDCLHAVNFCVSPKMRAQHLKDISDNFYKEDND